MFTGNILNIFWVLPVIDLTIIFLTVFIHWNRWDENMGCCRNTTLAEFQTAFRPPCSDEGTDAVWQPYTPLRAGVCCVSAGTTGGAIEIHLSAAARIVLLSDVTSYRTSSLEVGGKNGCGAEILKDARKCRIDRRFGTG